MIENGKRSYLNKLGKLSVDFDLYPVEREEDVSERLRRKSLKIGGKLGGPKKPTDSSSLENSERQS